MICLLPTDASEVRGRPGKDTHRSDSDTRREPEVAEHEMKDYYWARMNDHWDAKLWDVEPLCQVAGIAAKDTVILDGAYGATIHWDSFQRIAITTRETWSRMLARLSVRATPFWFLLGVFVIALSSNSPSGQGAGAVFLIVGLALILLSPMLILHLYSGKVWNTQPWLFGFEGHMDIRQIERKIWGFPCGRLSWAPYSSSLSRHQINKHWLEDECEGTEPLLGSTSVRHQHENETAMETPYGEKLRHFTIVDTYTM